MKMKSAFERRIHADFLQAGFAACNNPAFLKELVLHLAHRELSAAGLYVVQSYVTAGKT